MPGRVNEALPDPDLRVAVERRAGQAVVSVSGELDLATADRFTEVVGPELAQGPVVLDLAGLAFLDSSGVAALDVLVGEAGRVGHRLTVAPDLRDHVRQVLMLTGMLDALRVPGRPGPAG